MRSISSILRSASSRSPLIKGVTAAVTVEAANAALATLFGKQIFDHAQAAHIKNNVLAIACLSSSAAQEIKLHEARFIELVNKQVGMEAVKRVKYLQ